MEFIRRYIILFVAVTSVSWTVALSERKKCNEINAPNLRAKLRSKGRIANFSCRKRFELVGVKFAVCLDSGDWSQQIPTCVGTTCRRPDEVPNITVEELYRGGVLKFTCGAGLIRSGPEKLMCDGNKWSDEPPKCIEGTTLHCDFEDNGLCGWSQDFDDDFDWTWHQGETPTAQTGPRFDHTTNSSEGHYLYMESSAPQAFGQVTRLLSPPYLPTSMINMCLEFFYHMYGPANDGEVGVLAVYVKPLMLNTTSLGLAQRIFHQSGNKNDQWLSAEVPLPPMDDTFQIVFQATRMKSWSGDIAIDDVRLHSCLEETTTSSGPTESDDTDNEDKDQDPPVLKTTERTPLTTTAKPTTDSTATIRTTQLSTTSSTPPTTTSATPTTVPTPPTITSTLPTAKIVTVTTTEPTSTRKWTPTATTTSPAPSTTSVVTPSLRTTVTTLRTTSTPTSTSSAQTTTTTTSKPTKTSAAPTTASSESTRSTTALPIRPTTTAVKLTRPTSVTESTTTTTTTVPTTTTTSNDITSPASTAGTTSTATSRVTTVKATSEPTSADHGLVTTNTVESISAAAITSTSDSTDMTDGSTTKVAHVTSALVTATTDAQDIGDDTGSDNNDADVFDGDNDNPTTPSENDDGDNDNPTTPSENDDSDDNDEDDHETTKSISSSADYIDYDSTSEYLGQTSTFNTSEGHNGSQASASGNKDASNNSGESKPSQSETRNSLSNTHLNHGAVKEKDGLPSSSTTEVIPLIIGVATVVVVTAVVIAVLAYLWARNQRRKQEKEQEDQMNIITEYVETNLST